MVEKDFSPPDRVFAVRPASEALERSGSTLMSSNFSEWLRRTRPRKDRVLSRYWKLMRARAEMYLRKSFQRLWRSSSVFRNV